MQGQWAHGACGGAGPTGQGREADVGKVRVPRIRVLHPAAGKVGSRALAAASGGATTLVVRRLKTLGVGMKRSPESIRPGLSQQRSERLSPRSLRRLGSLPNNASARGSDLLAVVRSSEIKTPWYSSYSLRFTKREDEVDYLASQQTSSLVWIALPLLLLAIGRLSYDKSEDFGLLCTIVSVSALLVILETLNRDYLRRCSHSLWVSPCRTRLCPCPCPCPCHSLPLATALRASRRSLRAAPKIYLNSLPTC